MTAANAVTREYVIQRMEIRKAKLVRQLEEAKAGLIKYREDQRSSVLNVLEDNLAAVQNAAKFAEAVAADDLTKHTVQELANLTNDLDRVAGATKPAPRLTPPEFYGHGYSRNAPKPSPEQQWVIDVEAKAAELDTLEHTMTYLQGSPMQEFTLTGLKQLGLLEAVKFDLGGSD